MGAIFTQCTTNPKNDLIPQAAHPQGTLKQNNRLPDRCLHPTIFLSQGLFSEYKKAFSFVPCAGRGPRDIIVLIVVWGHQVNPR